MIVLEGIDSSGKSTLARLLATRYRGWQVVTSEGPAKSADEINDRITRYLEYPPQTIFDRHPLISEAIYGPIFGRPPWVRPRFHMLFWAQRPLIIYARPPRPRLLQQGNLAIDTPEYVENLRTNYDRVLAAYDEFFAPHPDASAYLFYDWSNRNAIIGHCDRYVGQPDADPV